MNWFLSLAIFNNVEINKKRKFFFAFFFPFFTLLALWIDSVSFLQNHFDGRIITNFLAILYFVFLVWLIPFKKTDVLHGFFVLHRRIDFLQSTRNVYVSNRRYPTLCTFWSCHCICCWLCFSRNETHY